MKFATTAVLAIWLACASTALSAEAADQWSRVEQLPLGSVVSVTDDSGAVIRGRLLRADGKSLLLYSPTVDAGPLKPIDQTISRDPRLLSNVDGSPTLLAESGIDIEPTGISRRGKRLAAFDEVFYLATRPRVVSVTQPQDQRTSAGAILAGVAVGTAAGWATAAFLASSEARCGDCSVRKMAIFGLAFGGPVAGGIAGNALGKPRNDVVIYTRR